MFLWWLTDVIGGWWLHLTSPLGLWGARLGGILLYACSGALAVYITPALKSCNLY